MSVLTRSQKRQREGDVAWNFLPNTAKLLIIQFLSLPDLKNVLLASKSWASVALNPKLWSSYCIVAKSQKDLVDAVNVSRYKFITKLRLVDSWFLDRGNCNLLPAIIARIDELNLDYTSPDKKSLLELMELMSPEHKNRLHVITEAKNRLEELGERRERKQEQLSELTRKQREQVSELERKHELITDGNEKQWLIECNDLLIECNDLLIKCDYLLTSRLTDFREILKLVREEKKIQRKYVQINRNILKLHLSKILERIAEPTSAVRVLRLSDNPNSLVEQFYMGPALKRLEVCSYPSPGGLYHIYISRGDGEEGFN